MKLKNLVVAVSVLSFSSLSLAELITADDIDNPRRVNFNEYQTLSNEDGPIQIGTRIGLDITVNYTSPFNIYANFANWGLGGNGTWGADNRTYLSFNGVDNEALIMFNSGSVKTVGAFMNYCPNCGGKLDLVITAYDSEMLVLETYDIAALAPISTPTGINEGAFIGINRDQSDIAALSIIGSYPALDNLTFSDFDDIIFEDSFE